MTDPYEHMLISEGDEWDDKWYRGLYVFPLEGKLYLARMRWIREGMGRDFYDPLSGNYLGCCGNKFAEKSVRDIGTFITELPSDLPYYDREGPAIVQMGSPDWLTDLISTRMNER